SAGRPGPGPSGDSIETILAHADGAFRDGAYDEAAAAYEQALRIDPDRAHAVAALATCYLKGRLTKKADDLLTAYLARKPDDAAARLVLARVGIREGDLRKATEALHAVLSADPDNLMANYNLGFVAYRSRDYAEAEARLRRTIELKPDHPEAHYTLGLTYLALGRTDPAIAELERVVAIDPKHLGAQFNLITACARAGRMKDAEKHRAIYAELSGRSLALSERETQIKAQSVMAIQDVLAKNYDAALREYQALVVRYPDSASLHHQIGLLMIRLGRREEALRSLQTAERLDPRLGDPHYLLAGLYREMGDEPSAAREMSIFATLETIPEG